MVYRIMIVDNDDMLTHMMKQHLLEVVDATTTNDSPAIDVAIASTPDGARALVRDAIRPFDVLLVDYRLDGQVNGIELIEELQAGAPDSETVLFTGYPDPGLIDRLGRAQIDDYLQKPFGAEELSWRVLRLLRLRRANQERDWLRSLSAVNEKLHTVTTIAALGKVVTASVTQLGFQRARFYRILDRGAADRVVQGVAQMGLGEFDLTTVEVPLGESSFVCEVVETDAIRHFSPEDERVGFLRSHGFVPDFLRPQGSWIGLPVRYRTQCEAVLLMDNDQSSSPTQWIERQHLPLLEDQLSAAYGRVVDQEINARRRHIHAIAQELGAKLQLVDQNESLEPFCRMLLEEVFPHVRDANLTIAIQDRPDWICEWIRYELGKPCHQDRWRASQTRTMTPYYIDHHQQPLFLPKGTHEFRQEHGLELQAGGRPAKSWMAAPLASGNRVVGALVLEHDERADAFSQEDFGLLCELSKQIGGRLFTTWFNLQRKRLGERLAFVQHAAGDIMLLAEQSDDWLWHATLTIATAHFGFSFDRALLLLKNSDGNELYGRMAIGHDRWQDAEQDWSRVQEARDMLHQEAASRTDEAESHFLVFWQQYLALLRNENAQVTVATPLARQLVQRRQRDEGVRVSCGDGSILGEIVRTNKTAIIPAAELSAQLPAPVCDFLYAGPPDSGYQSTECAVVPVAIANDVIGLLLLDNVWRKEPSQLEALDYIDTLTNQAAVLYQNRVMDGTRTELDEFKYAIFNRLSSQTQRETLTQICEKAIELLGAMHVAIYPVRPRGGSYHYLDLERAGTIGTTAADGRPWNRALYPLDNNALWHQQVRVVENTAGMFLHPFVFAAGIAAMIVVPVVGSVTRSVRAVMYVDYAQARPFTLQEIQIAKELAMLAATALRTHREMDEKSRRQQELERAAHIFGRLLQGSMEQQVRTAQEIVHVVLTKAAALLDEDDVSLVLALRAWQRDAPHARAYQVRQEYRLIDGHTELQRVERNIELGVRGRTLKHGTFTYLEDVHQLPPELVAVYHPTREDERAKLYVPITLEGEEPIGVLVAESPVPSAFSSVQIATMQRIGTAACMAFKHLKRQIWMQDILRAISQIPRPTGLQETLTQIGDVIEEALPDVDIVTILYRKSDENPDIMVCGLATGPARLSELGRETKLTARPLIAGLLAGSETAIYVENVNGVAQPNSTFVERFNVQAYSAQKITVNENTFGILFLSYCHPHRFTSDERAVFPILASTVAAALNDARRLTAIERQKQRFEDALTMTQAISSALAVDDIIAKVLAVLQEGRYFADTLPAIFLYDNVQEILEMAPHGQFLDSLPGAAASKRLQYVLEDASIVAETAHAARSSGRKRTILVTDLEHDHRRAPILRSDARAQLAVALFNAEKYMLIGVLLLESAQAHAFDEDAEKLAQLLATEVRIAVERGREVEDLAKTRYVTAAYAGGSRVAHEIRREVAAISNSCYVLHNMVPSEEHEHIDRIMNSIRRLEVQSSYVHEYMEQQYVTLADELSKWLEHGIAQYGDLLNLLDPEVRVEVGLSVEPSEIRVLTFPQRLGEVFDHLIRNSCEAFEPFSEAPAITVIARLDAGGQDVIITFEDNGPGIPIAQERNVFQPRKHELTAIDRGNGLLFVDYIVRHDLEGAIYYVRRDQDGRSRGAKFVLRLPLVASAVQTFGVSL